MRNGAGLERARLYERRQRTIDVLAMDDIDAAVDHWLLYLNGVYDANGYFWPVKPPTPGDLDEITHKIAKRVSRYLNLRGQYQVPGPLWVDKRP